MIYLKNDHSTLREELRLAERALKTQLIRDYLLFGGGIATILGLLVMGALNFVLGIAGVTGWLPSMGLGLMLLAVFVFLAIVLLASFLSGQSLRVIQRADRARNALDRATLVEKRSTDVSS